MLKVYRAPKKIKKPELDFDNISKYNKACDKYVQKIKDYAKKNGEGKYRGEEVSFNVADGTAVYIVYTMTPLQLIHCETYDEYQYIERLTKADIIKQIKFQKDMQKICKIYLNN